MPNNYVSGLILLAIIFAFIIYRKSAQKSKRTTNENATRSKSPKINTDYTNSYKQRHFMSHNEIEAYHKIKAVTDELNLNLFAKVRLFDLLEPKSGIREYKGAQWKIQAKHVDFVVCNNSLKVICIIELDDNSHNRADRAERDNFVDTILGNNGYRIFHTRNIDHNQLKSFLSI